MSNPITITGNLAADPELRFTPGGKAVASFTVMTSRSRKTETGEWENVDTTGWRCTAWETLAENIAESLTKGMSVIVIGRAFYRSWENKDGEKRGAIEVQAERVAVDLKRHTARVSTVKREQPHQGPALPPNDPWGNPQEPPF